MYECKHCDFQCKRLADLNRHYLTPKHKNAFCSINIERKKALCKYVCKNCGKSYNARNSLWYHLKKCQKNAQKSVNEEMVSDSSSVSNEMVLDIIKQNQEFKQMLMDQNKQMIEMTKNVTNNIMTNNNITNNNQTINNRFNLNVFLNEKCKDALNISDFINSLQISLNDVEQVGTCGFVEGISKIFVNGLKQLDVYKRPIHCSDLKREVMHLKENNVWEKEDDEKPKLIQVIKTIADKNIRTIPEWKQENQECRDGNSKKSDQYLQIMKQALGACDKTKDNENYQKIIKKVAKEVMIDKL
jgi:Zinc finger, C2H2 type